MNISNRTLQTIKIYVKVVQFVRNVLRGFFQQANRSGDILLFLNILHFTVLILRWNSNFEWPKTRCNELDASSFLRHSHVFYSSYKNRNVSL